MLIIRSTATNEDEQEGQGSEGDDCESESDNRRGTAVRLAEDMVDLRQRLEVVNALHHGCTALEAEAHTGLQ